MAGMSREHGARSKERGAGSREQGATEDQEKLKVVGEWSSNTSADLYGRMEKPGIEFSATMLQKR